MKKILCVVLMLCMMMTAALAEEATQLNWADFEPVLEAAGVTGQFYTLDKIDAKIWIPDGILPVELSEEDSAAGYLAYFVPEDQSAAIAVVYANVEGMSLEEYAGLLTSEYGATNVGYVIVNGLPSISYVLPERDTLNLAFATENGYILEITCYPLSEENAEFVWGAVISSIQAAE